ncbi:MFS transporter [Jiangella anatolica]|nr:MFS transporter [Jiangella anatolica]
MRVLPVSLGRSFNGLWFGTGAANLGDGMALFVLPLLALAVDASAGGVAAVTAALTLAWPVFGLHAGWIVDRVDRRALLGTVNAVRGLVLGGVTAAYLADALSLPLILAVAVLLGVAETLVDTALTSTIPLVVEPVGRSRANARIEATVNVTNQLAGPPLAGLLAGATLGLATGASAALYLLAVGGVLVMTLHRSSPAAAAEGVAVASTSAAAASIGAADVAISADSGTGTHVSVTASIPAPVVDVAAVVVPAASGVGVADGAASPDAPAAAPGGVTAWVAASAGGRGVPAPPAGSGDGAAFPGPAAGSPSPGRRRSELVAGFRFLWGQPVVRTLTLFTAAMNVVWAVATALLVVYVVEPGPLGLSAAQYGLLLTAMAVGGLITSVLVEPLRRWIGTTRLLILDSVGTVLLVAPVALGAGIWAVAAGAVIAGAGSSIWRIVAATIRQNLSPPELLGRIYSASRMISWGVIPASAALAGLIAELWGLRTAFAAATVLGVAVLAAFVPFALRTDLAAAVRGPAGPAGPVDDAGPVDHIAAAQG